MPQPPERSGDRQAQRRQTPAQERKIHKVMHEFKEGDLKSSSGDKVKSPKQAIAIAMSEAHADKPKSKRSHSKRSKAATKAMNTRERKETEH